MVITGGVRRDGVPTRTATGPRSETMAAASGSVMLRHWQSGFGCAGWCIGHCAWSPWTQVQLNESAACAANSDSGAAVRIES